MGSKARRSERASTECLDGCREPGERASSASAGLCLKLVLCLLWVPRPDDRRESLKHNPADAYDALSRGSLHPSKHSVEVLCLLWVPRPDDRRESFKHNPADAYDALSRGSLHPSKHSVEVLCLLWVPKPGDRRERNTIQLMLMMLSPRALYIRPSIRSKVLCLLWVPRPDDRRESFKHNPADADDALSPGSLHPSKHSVEVLCLLWVPRPDDRRERVLNTIQLMLMMLSPRALYIRPSIRSKCVPTVGSKARRLEREC